MFQLITGQVAGVKKCADGGNAVAISQQFFDPSRDNSYISTETGDIIEPTATDPFVATQGGRSVIVYLDDNPPPVGTRVRVILQWEDPPPAPPTPTA